MAHLEVIDVRRGPHVITARNGTLICDIDGTIADLSHRVAHVATTPKNWAAFERAMHLDTPIQPIIDTVVALRAWDWSVVLCTGRGRQNRGTTEAWLAQHGVPYDALYMRSKRDYRPDTIVKSALLERIIADGFAPSLVFEDRTQVVEMWRDRGLPVVQVAHGDF